MQDHLAFLKALYAGRLQTMLSALQQQLTGRCTWTQPQGGFFVGLWVDPALRQVLHSRPAQEFGLKLSDGPGFFVTGGEDFIRLPFCALQTDEIQDGIQRLSAMLTI
jgi:DNA-binding transcriptional MocR family regulator